MKSLLTFAGVLSAVLCMAAPATAQSLGAVAGEPWIGRPLDVAVPARFAASDDRDQCVHADVSYGDQAVQASRVRATVVGDDP
ncbi:MAG: hypothetical protein EOO24_25435, partial [Comamonadaceae bacterium]